MATTGTREVTNVKEPCSGARSEGTLVEHRDHSADRGRIESAAAEVDDLSEQRSANVLARHARVHPGSHVQGSTSGSCPNTRASAP